MDREKSWNSRPGWLQGNCKSLDRSPHFVAIFLEDSESTWSEEQIRRYEREGVFGGIHFLEQQAARWKVPLKIRAHAYRSGPRVKMRYSGRIGTYMTPEDVSGDIMGQIARLCRFSSPEDMDRQLRTHLHNDQVVYLVLVNKPGRSYALPDVTRDGYDSLEYVVVFSSYPGDVTTPRRATAVAHEVLHLFGAEDFYDPFGSLPRRKALAQQYYRDDIMMNAYADPARTMVGDVTAYTVGWLREAPEILTNEDFREAPEILKNEDWWR